MGSIWQACKGETNPQHSRIELVPINNKKEQLLSKKSEYDAKMSSRVFVYTCRIGIQLERVYKTPV